MTRSGVLPVEALMDPAMVVEAEVPVQSLSGPAGLSWACRYTTPYFIERHIRALRTFYIQRPLPSMLLVRPASRSAGVKVVSPA